MNKKNPQPDMDCLSNFAAADVRQMVIRKIMMDVNLKPGLEPAHAGSCFSHVWLAGEIFSNTWTGGEKES